jgi:RNA polymerase sigma-54 factor
MKGLKQGLYQSQQQKLSPQQIQFVKLLQLPVTELEERVKQELDDNMTLEEGENEASQESDNTDNIENYANNIKDDEEENYEEEGTHEDDTSKEEVSLDEIMSYDDTEGYKTSQDEEDKDELPIPQYQSIIEELQQQVNLLSLTDNQKQIAEIIIGSIEDDGYLKTPLETIQDDLDFKKNIKVSVPEIEYVLEKIRYLDPVGIGSRSLQECLVTQLKAKKNSKNADDIDLCIKILSDLFEEFTKKHYDKIMRKLGLSEEKLKELVKIITGLNPKPGDTSTAATTRTEYIIPDFTVTVIDGNKLQVTLNSKNAPELRINREYQDILKEYENNPKATQAMKDTIALIRSKIESAKWFIDAIKQRQNTLLLTMNCITTLQEEYFLTADESKLKPMVLKDVADRINMDISTVSRVANSKYVETDFGTFPLKHFFSEGIVTDTGEEVSNKEVKRALKEFIDNEDKHNPISDDELSQMLQDKGYQIARRTVAKYREQMGIPVARLRKMI